MSKHFLYFGLIACALSMAAGPSVAGPSKADLEKALSACPPGQSQGQDGLCAPSQGDQMGYDPQADTAPAAKPQMPSSTQPSTTTQPSNSATPNGIHRKVAAIGPMPTTVGGFVDLHMNFPNGSWTLTAADKATANALALALMEPANAAKVVEIGGHTSSTGSASVNDMLSKKRADAVRDYLIANGVPAARLKSVGYGSAQPLHGTDPAAPENRRVVLTMLGIKQP